MGFLARGLEIEREASNAGKGRRQTQEKRCHAAHKVLHTLTKRAVDGEFKLMYKGENE